MTTDTTYAETCVAGAILIDARCLPDVTALITEGDFYLEANRAIFRAAVELDRAGETVDPVTIHAKCADRVSVDYLRECMDAASTAANAEVYAQETRKASIRRALGSLAAVLEEQARNQAADPREVAGNAMQVLERIEALDTSRELVTSEEAIRSYRTHRATVERHGGGFVPTGFRQLDRILGGGLLCGGLYILAARPGMGKTTFAIAVAEHNAKLGPVVFVSLEMGEEELSAKRIACASGVAYDKLLMGELSAEERERAAQAEERLSAAPLQFNRRPWATVDDIASMARRVTGLRCLVIDYFGLIRTQGNTKRYEAMTEISGRLKALARTLKVPVLCLAQLNRENMGRKGNRPQLSDLRDTGALEQDADGVVFLHRPDYYDEQSEHERNPWEPVPMEIILAKNRHGRTGMCAAAAYLATGRIIPARRN